MSDLFERRVGTAGRSLWWVVLICAILVTANWIACLIICRYKPGWFLTLWGPDLTWSQIVPIWMWAIVALKLTMWLLALAAIWLTLWTRYLKNSERTQ